MRKVANAGKAECRELWATNAIFKMSVSVLGSHYYILMYKDVIRMLGAPEYITFLVNYDEGTIAVMPCDEKDCMSFKVSDKYWTPSGSVFRIYSKAFVSYIIDTFDIDTRSATMYSGYYDETAGAVIFDLSQKPTNVPACDENSACDE